jgi:hypothetical protein
MNLAFDEIYVYSLPPEKSPNIEFPVELLIHQEDVGSLDLAANIIGRQDRRVGVTVFGRNQDNGT